MGGNISFQRESGSLWAFETHPFQMRLSWTGIANTSKIIGVNISPTPGILICTHTHALPWRCVYFTIHKWWWDLFWIFFLRTWEASMKIVILPNAFPYALNAPLKLIFSVHTCSLCLGDHLPASHKRPFSWGLLCPVLVMTWSGAWAPYGIIQGPSQIQQLFTGHSQWGTWSLHSQGDVYG